MTLEEKRKEWEKDLSVVAERMDTFGGRIEVCLVILKRKGSFRDNRQNYFCHRYFSLGDNWEVSVDASYVDEETAMRWAFNPKAL